MILEFDLLHNPLLFTYVIINSGINQPAFSVCNCIWKTFTLLYFTNVKKLPFRGRFLLFSEYFEFLSR